MGNIQHDNINDEIEDEFDGRLKVSFTITGKDFIPDDVTAKLRIKPSNLFKRGDIKINSKGEEQVRKLSYWIVDTDNNGLPPNDPIPHFEWLLGKLEPVQEELMAVLADKYINARVSCFWITPDGRINMEVAPELLARIARLNVRIWFDIYCNH